MFDQEISEAIAEAAARSADLEWKYRVRIYADEIPMRLFVIGGKQMEQEVNDAVADLTDNGRRATNIDTEAVEHHGSLGFIVTIWHVSKDVKGSAEA
jgi:hypothetical protein